MGIANIALISAACIGCIAPCFGAALEPGKPTDDSVCDLSPGTTDLLGRRIFISGDLSDADQAVGYRRLAASFISKSCNDGQKLILNSRYGDEMDAQYLTSLSTELCVASDVARTDVTSTEHFTNRVLSGFELRCRISKLESFRAQFQRDEAKETTQNLIARLNTSASKFSPARSGEDVSGRPKPDCSKITLSAMMFGGGGCR